MNTDTLERHIQTCLLTDTCAVAGRLSNELVRYVSQIVSIAQRFSLFISGMSKKSALTTSIFWRGRSITTNKKRIKVEFKGTKGPQDEFSPELESSWWARLNVTESKVIELL